MDQVTAAAGPGAFEVDDDARYRAMLARDARFDGWFYVGVRTTGVYCRPSCPTPVHPKRANVSFHLTAAAAQHAGFRACKRCRPDATPGSPAWNVRADLAGRALRLVGDGAVDRHGVAGLARQLAVSERHLTRVLVDQVGAGPLALARAQRAHTARLLSETTDLPFGQVAFAAGFASIRQFNDTVRQVFAATPTELRAAARSRGGARRAGPRSGPAPAPGQGGSTGPLVVRLAVRAPFDHAHLWSFLARRAVPGVEEAVGTAHRLALALPGGAATVELVAADGHVQATLHLADLRDLGTAIARVRRLLDLDADPVSVDGALAADPALAPAVRARPGLRSPGAADPHEQALRAVLGQHVSVAAARAAAARLVAALAPTPTPAPSPAPTDRRTSVSDLPTGARRTGALRPFPPAAAVAGADPAALGLPPAQARAVVAVAAALAEGSLVLDPGADRSEAVARLLAIDGVGPWTASCIAMRSLSDPDALLATDAGARAGAARLGLPRSPAALAAHGAAWSPWRSYATHHLWAAAAPPPLPTALEEP